MRNEDEVVFTCWKEVAAYMGKGVRTVQRWEQHAGLPVQRPNARDKGIIRVSRKELDRWMRNRRAGANGAGPSEREGTQNGALSGKFVTARDLRRANRDALDEFQDSLHALSARCRELQRMIRENKEQERSKENAA
jgi:Helix-turn-helix domain